MSDPFKTYGPPELCVWRVENLGSGKGIFWFQTTSKAFDRKLSKRRDTRRVEVVGCNHFRRTYEMRGSWRKVKRLIDRYILSAGDRFFGLNRLLNASKTAFSTLRYPDPPDLVPPGQMRLHTTWNCTLSTGDSILTEATAQNAIAVRLEGNESGEVEDL